MAGSTTDRLQLNHPQSIGHDTLRIDLVAPPAAPSGWLLVLAIVLVAVFTTLRFWLAATLDLRTDEAYYWTWARQWVPSYLDHPPMVAWFVRIGQAVFGDTTLGARFGQILAWPLIELFLADIVRRRTGSWNAALFVVVLLECTLYYSMIVIVVEPSIPMLLFVSVMLWSLCRLDESMDGRWWLLAGAAAGLALLSKLLVFLLAPALLVFVLSRRHRGWLATRWPWVGLGAATVICLPFLVWNAQHGWATFTFQSERLGVGGAVSNVEVIKFVVFETLCAGLLLVPMIVVGNVRLAVLGVARRQPFEMLIVTAFLVPILFFLIKSLNTLILQSWAYYAWPIGVVGLALGLRWTGRWVGAQVIIGLVVIPGALFTGLLFHHGIWDRAVWLGKGDPFGQDTGYADVATEVLANARANGATWIATTDYRTYANLYWHIREAMPIVQVTQRRRYMDFSPVDPTQYRGRALYVHQLPSPPLLDSADRQPLGTIAVMWRGKAMKEVTVELLDNYVPDLRPEADRQVPSATGTWN